MDQLELHERGESRHERCKHGVFSREAYRVKDLKGSGGEPFAMPLCAFKPAGDIPPAMRRAWGGAIEFERDCALCDCFEAL